MDYARMLASKRVQLVLLVAALSVFAVWLRDGNPSTLDSNLGIEFVGGVRIPVTLERSVDATTMDSMVETIKTRINKFGLSQAIVRPLGDREILVEIPRADDSVIKNVEQLLKQQGKFEAVIDGRQALAGGDILTNAVGGANNEGITEQEGGVGWFIGFAASRQGADRFAKAALGKAFFPVYMFLDRPSNATVLVDRNWYNSSRDFDLIVRGMQAAVRKEGDGIEVVFVQDALASNETLQALAARTTVVADEKLDKEFPGVYARLARLGFSQQPGVNSSKRLLLKQRPDMIAQTYVTEQQELVVSEWRAIGLLSAPTLSPGLADGFVTQFYQVTGGSRGSTPDEQRANAVNEIKRLKSVISGGRLPVSTFIGSSYSVAPSLGAQFLSYSVIGIVLSVAIVAGMVMLRYRALMLIVPIVLINVIEMLVTLAIVGTFGTLDLAAMAGIITLIGTGVDDQIIITDELLRKRKKSAGEAASQEPAERSVRERIGRAFQIVFTVASVAIATMLPLFLSGIVEITGFALSYIIGVLVGVLITRPAYGVLVGEMFGEHAVREE